jgi:hypothetical protein
MNEDNVVDMFQACDIGDEKILEEIDVCILIIVL